MRFDFKFAFFFIVCLCLGLASADVRALGQMALAQDKSYILGGEQFQPSKKPFKLFASGRLSPGEHWNRKTTLPKGDIEFLIDFRRVDTNVGVKGFFEIIRSEGEAAKDNVLSTVFDQNLRGCRAAITVSPDSVAPAVVQLVNRSDSDVQFWIYALRPKVSPVPPLFGEVLPVLVLPTNQQSIVIPPGEAGYFRVRCPKGAGTVLADFQCARDGASIQSEFSFLGPHGEPTASGPTTIEHDGRQYRIGLPTNFQVPAYAVARVANRGKTAITCFLLFPVTEASSTALRQQRPIGDSIQDIGKDGRAVVQLGEGTNRVLRLQIRPGTLRILYKAVGPHSFQATGRLTFLDENGLETKLEPLIIMADQDEPPSPKQIKIEKSGVLLLRIENTGNQSSQYLVQASEAEE